MIENQVSIGLGRITSAVKFISNANSTLLSTGNKWKPRTTLQLIINTINIKLIKSVGLASEPVEAIRDRSINFHHLSGFKNCKVESEK